MESKRILRTGLVLAILTLNIGCDQISKTVVRQSIDYHEKIGLLNNYVTLTKVENSGAFLSLGNSLSGPVRSILLIILPLLALGFGFVFLLTKANLPKNFLLGLGFVIGGGIGNIYDRIIYGSVTDFLHIDFGLFQTGIFNMADVSIIIGILILLLHSFYHKASLNRKGIIEIERE